MSTTSNLVAYRQQLRAAGFSPIPANGKRPTLKEWEKCLDASDELIESWSIDHPSSSNTGLLARTAPALDIDILNADAVAAVKEMVAQQFSGKGRIISRTGLSPKALIPFRTDAPFKKIAIPLKPADGEKPEKLELLCEGQQFIAHGDHPDSKQPYTWSGGEPGEVKWNDLPQITQAEARQLMEDAAKLLVDKFGYAYVNGGNIHKIEVKTGLERPSDKISIDVLADALQHVANDDLVWDDWNRIGMALHCETLGSQEGLAVFKQFSSKSGKYNEAKTELRWREISGSPPSRISGQYILSLARASEIAKINKDYALVLVGDKAVVMKLEGKDFRLLKVSAFRQWKANETIRDGKRRVSIADFWMAHKDRKQYEGIEFAPVGGRAGYYNLWQGFGVQPKQGDCSKFLAHIRDNIAQGNEDHFNWIVGWFAQIFQQPGVKLGTSLVIRGPMGTGKTIIGKVIGAALGRHYMSVSSPRYVTGQFNSHMVSLLLLHADEAFWAGDRRSEGVLKDLVTGDRHQIEFKGVDPISLANYIRLLVTGNPEWVVPAGFAERRFATFDAGTDHRQDIPYFQAIQNEMANGGLEALVHHLLNFDLSSVNLREIPRTAALFNQQIESMGDKEAWWFDTLQRGELPGLETDGKRTRLFSDIYDSYVRRSEQVGVGRRSIETSLGMFLKKMIGPELIRSRSKLSFPPLKQCREKFGNLMQREIEWPDPDDPEADWQREAM